MNKFNKFNIGVLSKLPNVCKEVKRRVPNHNVTDEHSEEDFKKNCSNLDIVIADFDLLGPHLKRLEKVKWVQGTWAGFDALQPFLKDNCPYDMPIIRYSGLHFGRLISEYVITTIVNHERDFFAVHENQKRKNWALNGTIQQYRTIYDLKIGVMGVGNIGGQLITTLKFMGASVKAFGRQEKRFVEGTEYFAKDHLKEFLIDCDYIVNTLPNTLETKGLLNNDTMEVCKECAPIFINVGRGSIIADDHLIKAIDNKWLSGAYLDVFNEEPLPSGSHLWSHPKVRITPHVAAVSRAKDIAEQFAENLELFMCGSPIPNKIDYGRGY